MIKCIECPQEDQKRFYTSSSGKPFSRCMSCHSKHERERYYRKTAEKWKAQGKEYIPGAYQILNKREKMEAYDLIYIRKADQKIFHVRRIDNSGYSVMDPITSEKENVTSHFMRKKYECVPKFSNKARKKKLDFFGCVRSLQTQEKQLA